MDDADEIRFVAVHRADNADVPGKCEISRTSPTERPSGAIVRRASPIRLRLVGLLGLLGLLGLVALFVVL